MSVEDDEREIRLNTRWLARWTGLGVAALVMAFFSSGEIAASDPVPLASAGICLGVAIMADHHVQSIPTGRRAAFMLSCVTVAAFVFGCGLIVFLGKEADRALSANRQRCWAIQQDMLSAHPRMSNAADAFQALGCRPQGEDSRIFVPPTDRERAAGKPLPSGGYPPRAAKPQ